ncbi:BUD13 homolog [Eupeodes corollae]|uniref:BUD13 homolog n=1 Tax=Eupeodes corollae TaxID=290404 RepID=UPI00249141CE|nr:BUD13 homolog [Eupeodes corollae]
MDKTTTKISQKEYLKKYLSGDKKKKKKDKKLKTKATVKIIDDDVHINQDLGIDEELLLTGEDAPQIVGIVNVSGEPAESKWKSFGGIKKEEESDDDQNEQKQIVEFSLSKMNELPPEEMDSDQSPPRKSREKTKHTNEHNSPVEKRSRWNSDVSSSRDQSLQKKRALSGSRKDSDQSPQRRRSSPPPSKRYSDKSPSSKRDYKAPSRRDSDQSPPRRRSPPPRKRRDSDQSPPRRQERQRKNSDQSPRRKTSNHSSSNRFENQIKRENSLDQSPPRRSVNGNPFKKPIKTEKPSPDNSPRRRSSESPPPTHKGSSSKMSKTLDGKRAGLQNAQTLRIETEERRKNEDRMYNKMSKEISGRDAEVQVRKTSYRRHRKDIEEDPEIQRQKAEHEEKKKELYSRWNKGVKQIEAFQAKMSDDQYEGSKPLARYSNDADLEEMLRQKERDDDPMLEYIRSKKKDQQLAANVPVMPKYKGSYPDNRFSIPPGYRWDGVDRSNGYEKKWFDVQSSKQAVAEDAYLYSVEDM